MITNATQIIDASSLQETITRAAGVTFKRSGSNLVCSSPFTDEKTPSFSLSPGKGVYKCFSSGKGGNSPVKFLMQYRGYTYPEALEELANMSNIPVEYAQGNRAASIKEAQELKSSRESMIDAIALAHAHYAQDRSQLQPENEIITIASKSFTPQIVAKWGIVTAGDFQSLNKAAATWTQREWLIATGMLKLTKKGDAYYDFFHHRVLFPLYDSWHRIIGYNGRIITPDDKSPKYLNSPESIIYDKSSHVYGLTQNHRNISTKELAILVEGPTDVIILDQNGIDNAVAGSGTSFTMAQARKIAIHANMVIICFDNDLNGAGSKATLRAIDIIVASQMECKVKILPNVGDDPASFVTEQGAQAFKDLPVIDGIEYKISKIIGDITKASNHEKSAARVVAAGLIGEINDEGIRKSYISTIAKMLDCTAIVMRDTVKEYITSKADTKSKLTPEQEQQKMLWGFYIDGNKYYHASGFELSNFIIRPLFLVRGSDLSRRVFEIKNVYGATEVIQMVSDDFITMSGFKKKVEGLGNFLLDSRCKEEHYFKIKGPLYKDMETVIPIDVLGYHKAGFYAFSNGIVDPSGKFIKIDDYGIVSVTVGERNLKFYLPAFSNIDKADDMNDGENNTFDHYFVYSELADVSITLPKMIDSWHRLFGNNAIIALSYYFSAVFRDFIFSRHSNTFPILNLFGPPGSGKTFMARALTSFFGSPNNMKPINCVNSSVSSFSRAIAQAKNILRHFDEYGFEVTPEKVQVLKDFFDAGGRTLSDKNNRDKISQSVVRAACVLTGQILPAHDVALMERVVSIYTEVIKVTAAQKKEAQAFEDRANLGVHTQVTAELSAYRQEIITRYDAKYVEVSDHIRKMFGNDQPKYRFIANYGMIVTTFFIIADILRERFNYKLPWTPAQIFDTIYERIREQAVTVEDMDEVSAFFKMVEYLIFNNILKGDMYACEENVQIVKVESDIDIRINVEKTLEQSDWESLRAKGVQPSVLYLNMSFTHQLYKIHSKQAGDMRVLQESTLKNYLKTHPSYIGRMRGKRIGGKTVRVWAFDTTKLDKFSFHPTLYDAVSKPDQKTTADIFDATAGMTFNTDKDPFNT